MPTSSFITALVSVMFVAPVAALTLSGAAWAEGTSISDPSAATRSPAAQGPSHATPDAPEPPLKLAPYSLPWQLRPIIAPTVLRSDTSIALYENAGGRRGTTVVSMLTASYRIPGTGPPTAGLAPLVRVAIVGDDPAPGGSARGGVTAVNPLVGAAYAIKLRGGFRLNAFLGATLPIGGGGGNSPSPGALNSRVKGVNARAQLDNALFAVNDFTLIPGIGAAYVSGGFTVQVELTLLQLMRVRAAAAQREASKTNMTTGVHVGYFFLPYLSVGGELRYQRWLNAPLAVERDTTDGTRDTLSLAVGPRAHIKLGSLWFRPGVAYQRGLDKPLASSPPNYHIVQVDLPLLF